MTPTAVLSLFTGYGGLDLAVTALTGGELVGVSDIDPGPCKLLATRHPDVPNIGDVKAVDWNDDTVPHFDVLCGGYPCQPFSAAGRRAGTDDPRHLWPDVLRAIKARRPRQVFLENVRGHLTLGFDIVLRDLVAAGYSVRWSICAASSVGAPHRRERLYIYATPNGVADGGYTDELAVFDEAVAALPKTKKGSPRMPVAGLVVSGYIVEKKRVDGGVTANASLLPTPVARDGKGRTSMNRDGGPGLADLGRLLPTPRATDNTGGRDEPRPDGKSLALNDVEVLLPTPVAQPSGNTPEEHLRKKPGRTQVTDLAVLVENDLPTPNASDMTGGGQHPSKREGHSRQVIDEVLGLPGAEKLLPTPQAHDAATPKTPEQVAAGRAKGAGVRNLNEVAPHELPVVPPVGWSPFNTEAWGPYAVAIARWSLILGREAPAPVAPNRNDRPALTAEFAEWMMGLPAGWITGDDLGLSRSNCLKLAGNGVVPQAAHFAYSALLADN